MNKKVAIIKGLIAVAWADGNLNLRELEILNEYVVQFGLTKREINSVYTFIANPPVLEDLPEIITDIDDRLFLISQAYVMACADESLSFQEINVINQLVETFSLPKKEVEKVRKLTMEMFEMVLDYRSNKVSTEIIIEKMSKGGI